LVEQLALENGKVKPEAYFEVNMVPPKLRYYAALAIVLARLSKGRILNIGQLPKKKAAD
jgi:hypothetical protein